ncbi:hypothetical protein [Bifidobacterium tsurumiense]|uniref:hypothetical protein n=1 Tax=Bifidobacterium tsurumiense TaxID=356829 RepID=UPI0012B42DD4|nr:hypothetical protein [Bifidobacterium tsurumiense]MSS12663.1 hypothetical protein [Bifidobacterium tsurumiense]
MVTTLRLHIPEFVAALAAAVGTILYVVTSATGYLAGQGVSVIAVSSGIIGILVVMMTVFLDTRLQQWALDAMLLASEILFIVGFAYFVMQRVRLAADIYFIPVNYPQAEQVALNISLIGVACYFVAIVALIVRAFSRHQERHVALEVEMAASA